MDINKTINQWFEETLNKFTENISPKYPVDRFLLSSFLASRKYILASLILIKNDHKMPTKALLRVLLEFLTKLTWCLGIHEKDVENRVETVEMKRLRWWKATLIRSINDMQLWKNVSNEKLKEQIQSELHQLEELRKQCKKSIEPMPMKFYKLLNELPEEYRNDIYPQIYLKYNDAIHLDEATLGLLVQMQDGHIKYFEDSPESIGELLTQVVYCALMINDWIRIYYGWDTQQMRQEYESLLKQLSGKKYERKTF